MEEDDDPLEDFLEDTPLDRLIQAAETSQPGVHSIEFSGKEQFKLLAKNLMLKYERTLNAELRADPARIEAFELKVKPTPYEYSLGGRATRNPWSTSR